MHSYWRTYALLQVQKLIRSSTGKTLNFSTLKTNSLELRSDPQSHEETTRILATKTNKEVQGDGVQNTLEPVR